MKDELCPWVLAEKYDLILFDLDGTLVDRETWERLEGVNDWILAYSDSVLPVPEVAIITNQGGPACKDAGWGTHFPSYEETLIKVAVMSREFGAQMFGALAYQTKDGGWIAPVSLRPDSPGGVAIWLTGPGYDVQLSSSPSWRKPDMGMIRIAVNEWVFPPRVLVVGDRPEDAGAAKAAGVDFMWAWEFFERGIQRASFEDELAPYKELLARAKSKLAEDKEQLRLVALDAYLRGRAPKTQGHLQLRHKTEMAVEDEAALVDNLINLKHKGKPMVRLTVDKVLLRQWAEAQREAGHEESLANLGITLTDEYGLALISDPK